MLSQKEKWAEEMMSSLDGIQRAEPSPFLYHKIVNKITQSDYKVSYASVSLIAASFILLLLLNIRAIKSTGNTSDNEQLQMKALAGEYGLLNTNSISYN